MYPVLFHLGPLTIHAYGVLLALGAGLGLLLLGRLARSSGLDPERLTNLALWVLLAALAGARLMFVLLEPAGFLRAPWRFFFIWQGGLVFYGGVVAGLAVGWALARRWGIPLLAMMDCFAPPLALGQVFGRLGCFMAGCCYGRECDLPWAVTFTHPQTLAPPGLPLHPTQLYSAGALLAIFALLMWLWPRRRAAGQVFFTYGLLHGLARVVIEQFRGDWRGPSLLWGLTPTALTGLGLAAGCAVGLALLHRRGRRT